VCAIAAAEDFGEPSVGAVDSALLPLPPELLPSKQAQPVKSPRAKTGWLVRQGFVRCITDRQQFIRRIGTEWLIAAILVDDSLFLASNGVLLDAFMAIWNQRFNSSRPGEALGGIRPGVGSSPGELGARRQPEGDYLPDPAVFLGHNIYKRI
jgi:hypothetical protein